MSKHTPGPWVAVGNVYGHSRTAVMQEESALLIAEVCNWPNEETDHANARLIAAAPAMLAALQAIVAAYDAEDWPIENNIGLFTEARRVITLVQ
jgi:hypothetical protein